MANRPVTDSKPLRTSGSAPRMPRTFMSPSMAAVTERSWMPRCWATEATPAVRHPTRPTRTNSTGVVDVELIGGAVPLLAAEAGEPGHGGLAVRAGAPGAAGPPGELGGFWRGGQRVAGVEQGLHVHAV